MEALLWPAARLLQFLGQDVPAVGCRLTFFMPTFLSGYTFYLFFQALSFVIIFCNTFLATLSTQVVRFLLGDSQNAEGAAEVFQNPIRGVAYCYVYYSVFRVFFFLGFSMWTAMWEMLYDFPTLKVIVLGTQRPNGLAGLGADEDWSPSTLATTKSSRSMSRIRIPREVTSKGLPRDVSTASNGFDENGSPRDAAARDLKRKMIVIITPWVFLTCLSLAMVAALSSCQGWLGGAGQGFACAFFDPEARLNRSIRMSSALLAMQFLQCFLVLFPRWHVALARASWSPAQALSVVGFSILAPLSVTGVVLWTIGPTGTVGEFLGMMHMQLPPQLQTEGGRMVAGISIQISWFVWLLVTLSVIGTKENLEASGWSTKKLQDEDFWADQCAMFKFLVPLTQIVIAARSCTALGLAHAQNDIVTFTVMYPMLFCLMWTFTFVAIRISTYTTSRLQVLLILLGTIALSLVSWYMAHAVQEEGTGQMPVLVFFVWFNMCGEYMRVLKRWSNWAQSVKQAALSSKKPPMRQKSIRFAAPTSDESLAVKFLNVFMRVAIIAVISFCSILGMCALMATLQKQAGLYLQDIMWWQGTETGLQITNAGASVLNLQWINSTSKPDQGAPPREYMVCGQSWHGLQALDYALLSEMAYVRPTPKNDLPQLLRSLMPHVNMSIVQTAGTGVGMRPWIEFLLTPPGSDPISIVSVSGTAVDHVNDYLENIRMWTEPIVLMIINFLFPLTRTWGRETTALFIGSQHRMMGALGVRDQKWQYAEVLDRVRELARLEKKVVLTGHSLGGGIALVVGALTGQTTIALQPPGVFHSLAKHQAIQEGEHETEGGTAVHRKSLSVVVEGDWIQHFDQHGGLVQTMSCDMTGKSLAVGCHLLEGAICHMLRHCGDEAGRFAGCTHEYNPVATTLAVLGNATEAMRESWTTAKDQLFHGKQLVTMAASGLVLSVLVFCKYGVPFYGADDDEDDDFETRELN